MPLEKENALPKEEYDIKTAALVLLSLGLGKTLYKFAEKGEIDPKLNPKPAISKDWICKVLAQGKIEDDYRVYITTNMDEVIRFFKQSSYCGEAKTLKACHQAISKWYKDPGTWITAGENNEFRSTLNFYKREAIACHTDKLTSASFKLHRKFGYFYHHEFFAEAASDFFLKYVLKNKNYLCDELSDVKVPDGMKKELVSLLHLKTSP